jgi:hypothetical protein
MHDGLPRAFEIASGLTLSDLRDERIEQREMNRRFVKPVVEPKGLPRKVSTASQTQESLDDATVAFAQVPTLPLPEEGLLLLA